MTPSPDNFASFDEADWTDFTLRTALRTVVTMLNGRDPSEVPGITDEMHRLDDLIRAAQRCEELGVEW